MLVLTYNFATANSETTTLKLQTLTTAVRLVYLFQNCELNKNPAHLQPNFTNPSNSTIVKEVVFSHLQGGDGIVLNLWLRDEFLF